MHFSCLLVFLLILRGHRERVTILGELSGHLKDTCVTDDTRGSEARRYK